MLLDRSYPFRAPEQSADPAYLLRIGYSSKLMSNMYLLFEAKSGFPNKVKRNSRWHSAPVITNSLTTIDEPIIQWRCKAQLTCLRLLLRIYILGWKRCLFNTIDNFAAAFPSSRVSNSQVSLRYIAWITQFFRGNDGLHPISAAKSCFEALSQAKYTTFVAFVILASPVFKKHLDLLPTSLTLNSALIFEYSLPHVSPPCTQLLFWKSNDPFLLALSPTFDARRHHLRTCFRKDLRWFTKVWLESREERMKRGACVRLAEWITHSQTLLEMYQAGCLMLDDFNADECKVQCITLFGIQTYPPYHWSLHSFALSSTSVGTLLVIDYLPVSKSNIILDTGPSLRSSI